MKKTKILNKRVNTSEKIWNNFQKNYPYKIIEKLGEGTYGSVMKAKNLETG